MYSLAGTQAFHSDCKVSFLTTPFGCCALQSIFVTKIAPGGLAELDGRLRLGDKLVRVNNVDMTNATHAEAVAALKSVTDSCTLVVSREVSLSK